MTARRPAPGQPEIGYIEPGHVPAGYLTERPPSPWGSRLVHWAATAAVLAAVVCLVGWPWPTLYALGLLAGASILLAGIRLLATERRKPATDALAALHEGEEPYTDESTVPTPAQWIWRWNRATPQQRLDMVTAIRATSERLDRVQALAWRWQDADPLIPGEALADLRNALSDSTPPTLYQNVQAGDRLIRVSGPRLPTPDERRAIAALLAANDRALGRTEPEALPASTEGA